jgi:pimeloyl-ACP methyl ester carboxylesterase
MFVDVASTHTYYTVSGAGSPILFLHGVPDSAEMWQPVITRMQAHYRCYAPDLPGLGRSTAPDTFALTLSHMAEYLAALIEAAAIPTPLNLVVTDFGAPYGLAWAVTHPGAVRRIAVAGGANFFSDYRWHPNAQTVRRPIIGELGMAAMRSYRAFASSMRSSTPLLDDVHWRAVYPLSFAKSSVRRMVLRLYRSLDARQFVGWEDQLVELTKTVPMLVLWGDRDPFIAPSYADRYGAAKVEHFAEYDHWLAIEAPTLVSERLDQFFA